MVQRILVQFCPCGHTAFQKRNTISADILRKIDSGEKLDAPIKHSADCPQCEEDSRENNRMASYWDLD